MGVTAARYMGAPAPAPMRVAAYLPFLRKRPTRATGNCRPALADLEVALPPVLPRPPLPLPPVFPLPDMLREMFFELYR